MKHEINIEYLKCRTDLNFEVDFRLSGVIGTVVTKWDLILLRKWIVFIHDAFVLKNTHHMPLIYLNNLILICKPSIIVLLNLNTRYLVKEQNMMYLVFDTSNSNLFADSQYLYLTHLKKKKFSLC